MRCLQRSTVSEMVVHGQPAEDKFAITKNKNLYVLNSLDKRTAHSGHIASTEVLIKMAATEIILSTWNHVR